MTRATSAETVRAAVPGDTYRDGLLSDIVPFWLRHGLDRDGTVDDTDKSLWFQGRCGWLLGTLCTEVEPRDEWLAGCRSCVTFLRRHGFDTDGRMFFAVTRDGRPLRK